MPQTKFVLKKSLELGLKPIVVINKIDKPAARPKEVVDAVYELFFDLGASNEQLDFPIVYASSKQGWAVRELDQSTDNLEAILDVILEHVVPASTQQAADQPLVAQPFNLSYDNYLGRCAICRIYNGTLRAAQEVVITDLEGVQRRRKVTKLFTYQGIQSQEVSEALAGDIVMVAGLSDIYIGETIAADASQPALPAIHVDEPTITLNFLVNNSPFAGREGKFVTSRQIKERLEKELETNVGLKVDFSDMATYKVSGRGELHIAILLENLRREGYELQVSQPQVIIKEIDGQKLEPFEELTIDLPDNFAGIVIEKLSRRRGQMTALKQHHGQTRLSFEIPTRGLLGYRTEFVVDTRGEGILCSHVLGFRPHVGEIDSRQLGSMVSMMTGKALAFSLWNLQERGVLYIGPNIDVYEGMIIGNVFKGNDLAVNPIKGKQLTNMRSSGADDAILLTPPLALNLEIALSIMNDDEYLEVTPQNIRLRKQYLTELDRSRNKRQK